MSGNVPNLFDKLSLRYWYKYLLYLAGVLLVLTIVFGSKIPEANVISFSLWTIVLSTILWIIDGVLQAVEIDDYNFNSYLTGRTLVHIFVFIIWMIVAFATLH
jgi:hypothetical protein